LTIKNIIKNLDIKKDKMKQKEKIIIVNKNDEIIDYKERGTLDKEDVYRVSALWGTNSKSEVLLAQRSFNKKNHPRIWGPAVAGTNDQGETYESNIIKETYEEIGIKNIKPVFIKKVMRKGQYNHFTSWYTAKLDKEISEFKIQEDEVAQIKWFSKKELLNQIK